MTESLGNYTHLGLLFMPKTTHPPLSSVSSAVKALRSTHDLIGSEMKFLGRFEVASAQLRGSPDPRRRAGTHFRAKRIKLKKIVNFYLQVKVINVFPFRAALARVAANRAFRAVSRTCFPSHFAKVDARTNPSAYSLYQ